MGEAKRRRGRAATLKDLNDGMTEIQREGQGVWQLAIYGLEGTAELLAKALLGDDRARMVMIALDDVVRHVWEAGATQRPTLCLLCDNTFNTANMPAAWVMLHAYRDDPTQCVANGVCIDCWRKYPSPQALQAPVVEVYRNKMISDLHVMPPFSQPGHG